MSLAILPFSLKAAGFNPAISLSAATDVFRQMSGVIGTGYDPAPDALLAEVQPSGQGQAAPERTLCSRLSTPEGVDCTGDDSAVVSEESAHAIPTSAVRKKAIGTLRCRQAYRRAKVVRIADLQETARLKIELPVQPRVIAEILELKSLSPSIPVEFSRLKPESLACPRARKQREADTIGWQWQMNRWLKFTAPNPVGRFKTERPSTVRPPNRDA
jgi:hypothetical protein